MASLNEQSIKKAAQDLYAAEKERRPIRAFTEQFPGIEIADAYGIQLSLMELKKRDGAKVVGKKIGLTSKAMQKMLNVDQPDYGHILDNMMVEDGARFTTEELIQPKIEPERTGVRTPVEAPFWD